MTLFHQPTEGHVFTRVFVHLFVLVAMKVHGAAAQAAHVAFVNFSPGSSSLYWRDVDNQGRNVKVGELAPYRNSHIASFIGHEFVYEIDGVTKLLTVQEEESIFTLGEATEF